MTEPHDLFEQAERENEHIRAVALEAVEHFMAEETEPMTFEEAVELVYEEVIGEDDDASRRLARKIVGHLATDDVDPVIMVPLADERHVLVSDYQEGDWWYGFEEFDPVEGRGRKVVCCQCVAEEDHPGDVGKVYDADVERSFRDYGHMAEWLFEHHFERRHPNVDPDDVDIQLGASLASGTTINSNTAWHDGNVSGGSNISIGATSVSVSPQGSGSNLNADTVDGSDASDLGGKGSGAFDTKEFVNTSTYTPGTNTKSYSEAVLVSGTVYMRAIGCTYVSPTIKVDGVTQTSGGKDGDVNTLVNVTANQSVTAAFHWTTSAGCTIRAFRNY